MLTDAGPHATQARLNARRIPAMSSQVRDPVTNRAWEYAPSAPRISHLRSFPHVWLLSWSGLDRPRRTARNDCLNDSENDCSSSLDRLSTDHHDPLRRVDGRCHPHLEPLRLARSLLPRGTRHRDRDHRVAVGIVDVDQAHLLATPLRHGLAHRLLIGEPHPRRTPLAGVVRRQLRPPVIGPGLTGAVCLIECLAGPVHLGVCARR